VVKKIAEKDPTPSSLGWPVCLSEIIAHESVSFERANANNHKVLSLLNHNHSKIRLMAFALTECLFPTHFHLLSDTILSASLLIFALAP
jgi:hypothetical protein